MAVVADTYSAVNTKKINIDQHETAALNNPQYAEISECGHEKVCKLLVFALYHIYIQ